MSRITGTAAKKFFVKYVSDQIESAGPPPVYVEKKVLLTRRHIHWLRTIDPTLEAAPTSDAEEWAKQKRQGDKPRRFVLTDDSAKPRRRTLVCPSATHAKWTTPLNDPTIAGTYYTLEGESGQWKITGRIGEKDTLGTHFPNDDPGTT